MQDLVTTPVRPPAALPSGQNHGEQQDAAVVAVDLVTTPIRFAATLPTGQNYGEHGTTPACPDAPLPGRDNTDENQEPVANEGEKAKCATPVCDYCRGLDKPGGKAGR